MQPSGAAMSLRSLLVSGLVALELVASAVACRPRPERRDDVPRETETRGADVPVAPTERRVDPSDPQVPAVRGTVPAQEADTDVAARSRADAGRPRWVPDVDRLSIVGSGDRDRNLGVVDAGAP